MQIGRRVKRLIFHKYKSYSLLTEAVKTNLIETFDVAYRTPRTRLSSRFVVVEGEMAPYMEKTEKMGDRATRLL